MKFFYSPHYRSLQPIVASSEFHDLVHVLLSCQEPPTLRELKVKFPEVSFDKTLDRLIASALIIRKNRRYFLGFPVYTEEDQKQLQESDGFYQEALDWSTQEIADFIKSFTVTSAENKYFYGCLQGVEQGVVYSLTHETFQMITYAEAPWPPTLPAFFEANRQLQNLAVYDELMDLIGDVDPVYYLDQVSVIFERIRKNKKVRSSIFLESLQRLKIVSSELDFLLEEINCDNLKNGRYPPSEKYSFLQRLVIAQLAIRTGSYNTLFFNNI